MPDTRGIIGQFGRFASVGVLGFGVDLLATLMLASWIGPDFGRLFAIFLAVGFTFACNRGWTFTGQGQPMIPTFLRYCAVSLLGAAVNFGGYAAFLALWAGLNLPAAGNIALSLAVAAGSGLAMGVNFLGIKKFVFDK